MSRKHKIALVELAIILLVVLYFFCPRPFSWAIKGGFDPEAVTALQVTLTGGGQEESYEMDPKGADYAGLVELLSSKAYIPLYLNSEARQSPLGAQATLTFTQAEGEYTFSFSGDRALDATAPGVTPHAFQLTDSLAFQQEVLDYLLKHKPA